MSLAMSKPSIHKTTAKAPKAPSVTELMAETRIDAAASGQHGEDVETRRASEEERGVYGGIDLEVIPYRVYPHPSPLSHSARVWQSERGETLSPPDPVAIGRPRSKPRQRNSPSIFAAGSKNSIIARRKAATPGQPNGTRRPRGEALV